MHATTWMILENRSEVKEARHKRAHHVLSNDMEHPNLANPEIESCLVVAGGCGEG